MAQGGQTVTFVPHIDEMAGRIDILLSRPAEALAAAGSGVLANIQFEPIKPGEGSLAITGRATSADGQVLPLQFVPAQVRIR
jgi:hypothetical protein